MSFKSIIQEMKGEFESFSRKGFDVKFGNGSRSRSRQLVEDSSVPVDAFMQRCWANMPPELLRDVLMRIEESESTWPDRRNVVACAGVCRNWRDIVKEIVKTPEVNSMLTFPISLKQPGPRDSLIQCFIKRDRICQTYSLYLCEDQALNDNGKFLLSARKCRRPTCTDYMINLTPMATPKAKTVYIGKLRSNFLGTKFTIFDAQPPNAGAGTEGLFRCHSSRVGMRQVLARVPVGSYPISHISYELNALGSRGPRRMHCVMDAIPASAIEPGGVVPTQIEFVRNVDSFLSLPFLRSKSISGSLSTEKDGILMLRNKAPRWHEQLQCWCLNFNGRVTVVSVKNFQLVACVDSSVVGLEPEKVVLQFGKVGKDLFTMDYQYPISAFQAFAICLSSFDTKIACE
ncbi:tubby-like F-box protein 3 [Heracleum sosnowskyi]|uniref:Tubby-like F-box protein 3 n=1 Tax=Heracleum sosnowskyi TaxID=360622 RepID=A0AAD8JA61_9APIA|nr:tubby-like F-box protein 3 [Heracleum sosnowskyi]